MEASNIIAVYNKNKQVALQEFDLFMNKTNTYMNRLAQDTDHYIGCDSKQLEKETILAMRKQCEGTSFLPDDIQLISGQRFPDIIAAKHFGVEVKSTKENKWVSIGSSIVESTRIEDVNHIYMLFGKLGGHPVEFKCKPYQNCLYDIAVTHSPRYLIDMETPQERTIFSKWESNMTVFVFQKIQSIQFGYTIWRKSRRKNGQQCLGGLEVKPSHLLLHYAYGQEGSLIQKKKISTRHNY